MLSDGPWEGSGQVPHGKFLNMCAVCRSVLEGCNTIFEITCGALLHLVSDFLNVINAAKRQVGLWEFVEKCKF